MSHLDPLSWDEVRDAIALIQAQEAHRLNGIDPARERHRRLHQAGVCRGIELVAKTLERVIWRYRVQGEVLRERRRVRAAGAGVAALRGQALRSAGGAGSGRLDGSGDGGGPDPKVFGAE